MARDQLLWTKPTVSGEPGLPEMRCEDTSDSDVTGEPELLKAERGTPLSLQSGETLLKHRGPWGLHRPRETGGALATMGTLAAAWGAAVVWGCPCEWVWPVCLCTHDHLCTFGCGVCPSPQACSDAVPCALLQMNRPIQVKPADSESRGGSSCLRQPPSREGSLVSAPLPRPTPPFLPLMQRLPAFTSRP